MALWTKVEKTEEEHGRGSSRKHINKSIVDNSRVLIDTSAIRVEEMESVSTDSVDSRFDGRAVNESNSQRESRADSSASSDYSLNGCLHFLHEISLEQVRMKSELLGAKSELLGAIESERRERENALLSADAKASKLLDACNLANAKLNAKNSADDRAFIASLCISVLEAASTIAVKVAALQDLSNMASNVVAVVINLILTVINFSIVREKWYDYFYKKKCERLHLEP